MNKRAALYCRVSTDDQATDGYSLDHQEAVLRAAAEDQGLTVVGVYRDDDSGRDENRTDFQRMYLDAKAGAFDAVLVYSWSRWFRNMALSRSFKDAYRKKLGIEVRSVTQPGNPDDASTFLTEGVFELFDEYHSIEKSMLVRAGKRQKAIEGLHCGNSTLGYVSKRGHLQIRPDGAKLIRYMADLYEEPDGSFSSVAKRLSDEGLVNPLTGEPFSSDAVRRALQSPTNAGFVVYGDQRFSGRHQPILEPDRFDRLLVLAERRRERAPVRHTYRTGVLSRLCRCARCGSAMTAWRHDKNASETADRLKCDARRSRSACNAPGFVAYPIVEILEEILGAMEVDPTILAMCDEAPIDDPNMVRRLRAEIEDKMGRAGTRYEMGEISEGEYRRRIGAYRSQLDNLPAQQAAAEVGLPNLGELLKTYGGAWRLASTQDKNALLKSLVLRIDVDREQAIEIVPKPEYRRAFQIAMESIGPITALFPKVGQTPQTRNQEVPVLLAPVFETASDSILKLA
jgi:site-specific DNA recombinase